MKKSFKYISLKTKLTFLYSVLLILSVVFISFYSYWNIWDLFTQNEVSHLRSKAKPIIEHWVSVHGLTDISSIPVKFTSQTALLLAQDLTSKNTVAVILTKDKKIIADGRRLPEEPISVPPDDLHFKKAMSGINEVIFWKNREGKPTLFFLIPLRPRPGSGHVFGVIQISTTLSDINEVLFRYGTMQVTAVVIILFLGIVIGYWLIGLNLNKLQKFTVTCQEVAKENFTQRIEVENHRDEIGKLAESFNIMIVKLETIFNAQKRFSANAAHELLTPLTGIRGSFEVLFRGAQDDPESREKLSKGMYQEVNRLIRVCDQLLGLSRLENSSNVGKQPVFICDFIQDFRLRICPLIKNNPLAISAGPFLTVQADPDLLEQILLNLFSNVVCHCPPGTPIVLGWKIVSSYLEIWVSDEGPGIDKDSLDHVFEPFYRVNSIEKNGEKGAGLGLALARSMVEAQGGTIKVFNENSKGTTVYFSLPLF